MKRPSKDFSGIDTPLFSTMMGVSPSHGEASRSQPTSDHPTDDLPIPLISTNPPQIPIVKTTSHITKTYIRKKGVSHNPKKVLTKEQVEHVGSEAHTTDFAQSAGQDSVNIPKTFPTATLGEQSSKGPRVVNTPKGGEDRYNYVELMETIANVNMDVLKQGAEIEEMKLVILSQQVQITKLKKMVLRLVQKKKRTQFVLKKRSFPHDASKKEEIQAEVQTL
ncbi:hypothetical protein L6452_37084 [Arctium lappa]|uniref:Uncharacterized protein n=1 Tax=Arctium lappa TaxID=4217 RepID=A0ACB8Y1Y0_ARCLA|nr:hypothetical protein L6452_37084 [Arctium lappa]